MVFGIVELHHGQSGKRGFYNSQEIGLARAMKKLGYACVVFYPKVGIQEIQEERIEDDILVVTVPAYSMGTHAVYDWRVLLHYGVEVAQIGSDTQLFMPYLEAFCNRHQIRCYHFVGTAGSDSNNILKKSIMDCLYRRNIPAMRRHRVFAKTNAIKKKLLEFGIRDVVVAPVGLDTTVIPEEIENRIAVRQRHGIGERDTVVLFVGRIDAYKRPMELFKLAELLPECRFMVIGSGGMEPQFEEEIKAGQLTDRITWIRQIANSEMHAYYRAADYSVNFNQKEIFGMSILEAMYHGCTVIANHAPGPDEIIEDKVSGHLVDNTQQMAELILEGKQLPKTAVQERITSQFLWDNTAARIHDWICTGEKTK